MNEIRVIVWFLSENHDRGSRNVLKMKPNWFEKDGNDLKLISMTKNVEQADKPDCKVWNTWKWNKMGNEIAWEEGEQIATKLI